MNRLFRKVLSIICMVFIVFSLSFNKYTIPDAKAIKDFHMEISPRAVNAVATYKFIFTIEKAVHIHYSMSVVFPPGTVIDPPIPEEQKARWDRLMNIGENIFIGDRVYDPYCPGLPIIKYLPDGSISLSFNTAFELDPNIPGYANLKITIFNNAGFKTPKVPGNYIYKISTMTESNFIDSEPFELIKSQVDKPFIKADPVVFGQPSTYQIDFRTGLAGYIDSYNGFINIKFPDGTKLSNPSKHIKNITFNGYPITSPTLVDNQILHIPVPFKIHESENISIVIDSKAGITNPPKPGDYYIEVSTSTEPEWIQSHTYTISKAPTKVLLSINPPKINKNAEYILSYIQENAPLNISDTIQVQFPSEIKINNIIDPSVVLINDKPVKSVSVKQNIVELITNETLPIDIGVSIKFTLDAGIINPSKPETIQIKLKPNNYSEFIVSNQVFIKEQKLEITNVEIDIPNANEITDYKINVIFGDNLIPQKGDKIFLYINVIKPEDELNPIEILVDFDLPQDYILTIENIKNPAIGAYNIRLSTTKEPGYVYSKNYNILAPLPITIINVNGGKKGKSGWYLEPPNISFTCNDSNAEIFYWFNKETNQQPYIYSTTNYLDIGQYIFQIHYYAKSPQGNEKTKTIEIKVDTVPPDFKIIEPKEKKIITNLVKYTVKGNMSLIKTVKYGDDEINYDTILSINNNPVTVSEKDGTFTYDVELSEGENIILFHALDEAGNSYEKDYTIILDSTPPKIEIIYPFVNETLIKNPLTIKGITEPNALLMINGVVVYVEDDGTFSHDINIDKVGEHIIYFEAADNLGNAVKKEIKFWFGYTIILQIGNNKATTNGIEKDIPITPFIKNGKTLIPFRFIGEQLNAKIGFTIDPITKLVNTVTYELDGNKIELTIGSDIALVNGKKVTLDVPAQIIMGVTVVPLRFVTEGLNCSIDWEPESQTITVLYPKL